MALSGCGGAKDGPGWPARWDRILVRKGVAALDQRYDAGDAMLRVILGPEYRYHTRLRECRAHPTRDSLDYALSLLEEGSEARVIRARSVLERVVPLQVTDPGSKWYGIWGYYLEEPPDRMDPADWNWADFNGSLLLLVEFRHGQKLGAQLSAKVLEAIGHAARSVMRRNVSMSYTNIAVQGTFVTLAAAELLGDQELAAYSRNRLTRLARQIDETGSFAEYNSPTYARVTITNLTRIRMFVKDEQARQLSARLEKRAWLHLAAHWDAARKQISGPMSRCYGNDLGQPLWLEKALGRRLGLADPENKAGTDVETAIHDYRCPEDLAARFLTVPAEPREHREMFIATPPTSGTTYFSKSFSIGSADRADFWVQRRGLLGYFGDATRPARTVGLRVIKDGYDFSSALLTTVQRQGRVLGLINFRNPGGDKHISLDMIRNGEFDCGRLFAELDIEGLPEGFRHSLDGDSLRLESPLLAVRFQLLGARFGTHKPKVEASTSGQSLTATIDFKPPATGKRKIRWSEFREAWMAFALEVAEPGAGPADVPAEATPAGKGLVRLKWGDLEMEGMRIVAAAEALNAAFRSAIGGQSPAPARLSDERLANETDHRAGIRRLGEPGDGDFVRVDR